MPAVSIMIKPASSDCNLNCKYCFYRSIADNRAEYSHGRMSYDTLHTVIDRAISYADGDTLAITFQGGEPLLATLAYYQEFVAYAKQVSHNNTTIHYSIQTNGTLITEEWCEFFKANDFLIGLSLDGNKALNSLRCDTRGNDTFHRVMSSTELMTRHGVSFNILTVVTRPVALKIDKVYSFFKKCGFRYLQFIPVLKPIACSTDDADMYIDADDYKHFLITLFGLYYQDITTNNYHSIRYFDNIYNILNGKHSEQCGVNGRCSPQLVIESNGNTYPCDFYCLDDYLLGNINESDINTLIKCERMNTFLADAPPNAERCSKCQYNLLCGGGCKRQSVDADYCASYKSFFQYALPYYSRLKGNK